MTAPTRLPMCPLCGGNPLEVCIGSPGYRLNATVEHRSNEEGRVHYLSVSAQTPRQARSLWRRLGGRRA